MALPAVRFRSFVGSESCVSEVLFGLVARAATIRDSSTGNQSGKSKKIAAGSPRPFRTFPFAKKL
tara:strand:- start:100 stop:294 length:195 start_codon:yes stop_codon:yes gene_type:complete